MRPTRALSLALAFCLGSALLAGCAALSQLTSTVVSYSQWPAGRAPGSYAFERLPSQQLRPEQQILEDAARPALRRAGFVEATGEKPADVTVQLAARVTPDRVLYDDPWFWRGPGYGRISGGYWGSGWGLGLGMTTPNYEREVALLVRDRRSGQMLYETRATNDGASPILNSLLPAMFDAALADFPHASGPRRVTTAIPR